MKRYDNFGDYMFDLLFAPLKKGKEAANQFRIFFRVIGKDFDDVKKAFFRVRDEANVVSPHRRSCSRYTVKIGICRGLKERI